MEATELFEALLTPGGLADPHPLYAAQYGIGDAVAADRVVFVPGVEVASAVLRSPLFQVADAATYDEIWPRWREHPSMSADSILTLNQPEHSRIRGLISRAFTQRRGG